jgi:hypothetical protein
MTNKKNLNRFIIYDEWTDFAASKFFSTMSHSLLLGEHTSLLRNPYITDL